MESVGLVRARYRGERGRELGRYVRETVKDREAGGESGTLHIASETMRENASRTAARNVIFNGCDTEE